jgi:ABC-type glycerol-3-phosphate transport system substrate-binding protein
MNIHLSSLVGTAAIALVLALGLAGCGNQESSTGKTTASYQGKPDTEPWNNSRWHDNREVWERAITAREQGQNEYVRIPQ